MPRKKAPKIRIIAESKYLSVDHILPQRSAAAYLRRLRKNIIEMWARNEGSVEEMGAKVEIIKIPQL